MGREGGSRGCMDSKKSRQAEEKNLPVSAAGTLEALLFAAGNPLPLKDIAGIMELSEAEAESLLRELQMRLSEYGSGLVVQNVAGGWQLVTRAETFATVERLSQVTDRHLSAPTMETLSIIAFKQPITKPEIEQLRGVRVERAIAKLLELDLIEELGRKQVIGRPILYGTTGTFLRCFGLNSLDDLPKLPERDLSVLSAEEQQLLNETAAEPAASGKAEPSNEAEAESAAVKDSKDGKERKDSKERKERQEE